MAWAARNAVRKKWKDGNNATKYFKDCLSKVTKVYCTIYCGTKPIYCRALKVRVIDLYNIL